MLSLRSLACASISLVALATSAHAQEAAATDGASASSSEIIVQARRKDESIQDVPLVVQAVSGQDLAKLEVRRFEDITSVVPGLQLAANTSGIGTTASLRGVNFDANASGASTTVEFYRNDSVITSGALFQAMYDIGQIEVLRGPQGTLRGRASPSGSITVTTRRPDLSEFGGTASVTGHDRHGWNGNFAVNLPILTDKLALRVAGFTARDHGNQVTGINVQTKAKDEKIWNRNQAIRASLRADPFDGLLVLDGNYEHISHKDRQFDQVESFNQVLSTAGASPVLITADERLGAGGMARTSVQTYDLYNWQAQLNLAGQKLTYVGSKISGKITGVAPQDAANLFASPNASFSGNLFAQQSDNQTRQTTHELRLQNESRILGMLDYVVGGLLVKSNSPTMYNGNTGFGSATQLYEVSYSGRYRYRSDEEKSLFGNVTLHLNEKAELAGGVRRIWFKADSGMTMGTYTGANSNTSGWTELPTIRRCFGNAAVAGCGPTKTATIYNATGKYNLTDDVMAYASYGTSWRPGNSVVGYQGATVGTFLGQFLNLPDEKSKSIEVGVKSAWFDNRLRLNLSAYQQKFTNYAFRLPTGVVSISNPAATPVTLASAFNFVAPVDAKVKGLEAEISYDISSSLKFGTTITLADGKIKNGLFPCVDLNNDNVPDLATPTPADLYAHVGANQVDTCRADASPSSSARWSGSSQAEYTHTLGNLDGYLRGLVTWKGNSVGDGLNPYDSVKAYGLVNLYAGVRGENDAWEVSLYAKNVTGTDRVLTRSSGPLLTSLRAGTSLVGFGGTGTSINSSSATNYAGITTTAPREIGVNLRFSFGSR